MVVDGERDEFPAGALAAAGDVEMDHLAGFVALVAWPWLLRLVAGEQAQAAASEDA
jgi:hypothetical protein